MKLSKQDIKEIRKRLAKTDGGIKGSAQKGGITERVVNKMLAGENVEQASIDKFLNGLEGLEKDEADQREANSRRARDLAAQPA